MLPRDLHEFAATHTNGPAIREVGEELFQSQYRIAKLLGSIRYELDIAGGAVQRGHETSLHGDEITQLLVALGERNALLRTLKRLGVDAAKL